MIFNTLEENLTKMQFTSGFTHVLKNETRFKKGKPCFKYWKYFTYTDKEVLDHFRDGISRFYSIVNRDSSYNFLYAAGEIPILLVAHVDTVFKKPPYVQHDRKQNVLWSETGLGADDRAGVAAILALVEAGYRPHILLCNGEESGGWGAEFVTTSIPPKVNAIIEFDRMGSNDSVYYNCNNNDFEKYINSFGFETDSGSFSDISILCPSWKIAGVNLSIGYYGAHTSSEYLKLNEWADTVDKIKKILENPPASVFEYVEKYRGWGDWDYYDTFMSMGVEDITFNAYIDDLVMMYGGNPIKWAKWLEENEYDIRNRLEQAFYNTMDELINTNIPEFLVEEDYED